MPEKAAEHQGSLTLRSDTAIVFVTSQTSEDAAEAVSFRDILDGVLEQDDAGSDPKANAATSVK